MKDLLFIALGFLSGAVVGFAWSQETKSSLAENVTTDFDGGVMTVTADIYSAGIDGVRGMF